MHVIAFDLKVDELKKYYGEPCNKIYDEIRQELENLSFEWMLGSVYMSKAQGNTFVCVSGN